MARLANPKYGPSEAVALGGYDAKAALTTALAGSNNDLVFTANQRGTNGNSIRVRYVVSGNNTALSVSVSGNDITVNSATDGSAVATSTGATVKAAIEASSAATALVSVSHAASNDGTGVVAALAFTNLSGGVGYTPGQLARSRSVKAPL